MADSNQREEESEGMPIASDILILVDNIGLAICCLMDVNRLDIAGHRGGGSS